MATSKTKTISKSASGSKSGRSNVGAPSQHSQSTRKGKRAWRKNVNIEDVEVGLESMRAEERVTGTALQKIQDKDLFQIDVKGDDHIRKSLPRYSASQLTSTKILAQRSAVPAVFSRPSATSTKRKSTVTREDKERLTRLAKRPRQGPFNSVLDPSEYAAGSSIAGLSEAVKTSGAYDPWAPEPPAEEVPDGLETVQKKKPKAPVLKKTRELIDVPAIVEPHQGTSYNPPVDAHQELLLKAAAAEDKHVKELEKMAEVKKKMDSAKHNAVEGKIGVPAGMVVQEIGNQDEEEEVVESTIGAKAVPARKTKLQRKKASRLLAEKQALAAKAQQRRLLGSISDAKAFRRTTAKFMSEREALREKKRLLLVEQLKKQGLAGQKLGKHKVPEGDIDVQLGEDLSEHLRGLKPEGNLFRDRFQSLQQRALIEPRVRVLPKKRRNRFIEYEKHAWKKFE